MKKLFILGIFLLSSITISAQLLWKVSGKDITKPSFIMGTHHLASIDFCDKIQGFEKALESCDEVYGEIEKGEMSQANSTAAIMKYGMAPKDSMFTNIITKEQCSKIDGLLEKYTGQKGMVNQFAALKPVIITLTLEVMRTSKAFPNFDPTKALDVQIQENASALGKKLNGLETMDYQMQVLFNTPINEQIDNLLESVDKDDKMTEESIKIADYYKQQNIDKILETMNDPEVKSSEQEMNKLIYNRNSDWAKKISPLLSTKSLFICVGSAHLPGKKGILQLLRNEGYKVEPVK